MENYFENFTIENKTTDLSANLSKTILLLEELDSQRFSIQQKIEAYDVVYSQIKNSNDALELNLADVFIFPNEIRQEIDKLNTLYQENEILLSSYKEKYPCIPKKKSGNKICEGTNYSIYRIFKKQVV